MGNLVFIIQISYCELRELTHMRRKELVNAMA